MTFEDDDTLLSNFDNSNREIVERVIEQLNKNEKYHSEVEDGPPRITYRIDNVAFDMDGDKIPRMFAVHLYGERDDGDVRRFFDLLDWERKNVQLSAESLS